MKITILIVAGIIVIGLILYFIIIPVFVSTAPSPVVNANANKNVAVLPAANTNIQPPTNQPVLPPPAEVAPAAKQAAAARTIALSFAARLATYNNQNGLANLNDLQSVSTPAVWQYVNGDYRAGIVKSLPAAKTYYAKTSTVINVAMAPVSDTEVSAKVQLQSVESGAVTATNYVTLDLVLKNINGVWLVARLDWEK